MISSSHFQSGLITLEKCTTSGKRFSGLIPSQHFINSSICVEEEVGGAGDLEAEVEEVGVEEEVGDI